MSTRTEAMHRQIDADVQAHTPGESWSAVLSPNPTKGIRTAPMTDAEMEAELVKIEKALVTAKLPLVRTDMLAVQDKARRDAAYAAQERAGTTEGGGVALGGLATEIKACTGRIAKEQG